MYYANSMHCFILCSSKGAVLHNTRQVFAKVIYPKYYKNSNESSNFGVLGGLGCEGSTENFCNFATFEAVFSKFGSQVYFFCQNRLKKHRFFLWQSISIFFIVLEICNFGGCPNVLRKYLHVI